MGTVRTQKKYCDYRCWCAKGKYCSCWCGGVNHGLGYAPVGFDPKYGLTEAEFKELTSNERREDASTSAPDPGVVDES